VHPLVLVRFGSGYLVVQIGRRRDEVICLLIFCLALFFPIFAAHLQDDKSRLQFTRFLELRRSGGRGRKSRKGGKAGGTFSLEEAAKRDVCAESNRRFWSGQLQMQGATSEAADATVAAMMDEELASLVKNTQTAILQKAILGLKPGSVTNTSSSADVRSQNTLNTSGESSREGGHVHDAYLQRSESWATGYVGIKKRQITDGTYVYDIHLESMLPTRATPQMKEQLKRKARDKGYKTMTFNTPLAAARARSAIMDV
jgi:hypothetical protein